MSVRMWCLRHAESENITAGIAGTVPWSPLTKRGRRQAAETTRVLDGEPITRIYSSTALRAQQTAEIIASRQRLDVVAIADLAEVGIGEYEGTTDSAVRKQTAEVLRAWIIEHDLEQRVANGESGREVFARMAAAFRQIASVHRGETVAVVGHVASLTVTVARLCALGSRVWGSPLPPAEPFLVEWDGSTWHCPSWPT
ncbi:histidine phosphatase family protein [Nocardia vinacea]|uniref:histidine phosphatase family protein n=1 Tax=Nocardia vinacea TaxID=96468 RepID=UPI001C3F3E5F|nr:histidine phosphatase family protein [Nocardia vinacea]